MKRTTLVFTPKPCNDHELKQLIEAIAEKIPVKPGRTADEIEVAPGNIEKVQRILHINGYDVVEKSKLHGAIDLLGEKYQIEEMSFTDDRPKEVKPPPSVHKRNVMNFVNRKARQARKNRKNTRVQGKRDRLDGKLSALEDMLRYLRKR